MRLSLRAGAALAACLTLSVHGAFAQEKSATATGPQQALYTGQAEPPQQAAAFGELADDIELTGYSDGLGCGLGCGDEVGCGDCCGDVGCGNLCGNSCRCGQFFFGGEYMQVRANPSEAIAFLCRDTTDIASPTDQFFQFEYDHDGAYRLYGGYRLCNCGEEIRFTYTSFDSGSEAQSPQATTTTQYIAPLEVIAVIPGQSVSGRSNVSLDDFDLGYSKTIPLGSPMGCCDPCNPCCWCPAWDLTWTAAFRYADLDQSSDYFSQDAQGAQLRTARTSQTFEGAGGRMGLLGRRYLGRNGIVSGYLKGDLSVLLGDIDNRTERSDVATPGQVTIQTISCEHIVPVTEIEAGLSASITCNTVVSAGYMLGAWHDLGGRDEYDFGLQIAYDDANIMGFDGWFVRLESGF
jgi:hypothetical protein